MLLRLISELLLLRWRIVRLLMWWWCLRWIITSSSSSAPAAWIVRLRWLRIIARRWLLRGRIITAAAASAARNHIARIGIAATAAAISAAAAVAYQTHERQTQQAGVRVAIAVYITMRQTHLLQIGCRNSQQNILNENEIK